MALQPKKIRVLLINKNLLIFPFAYVEIFITLLLYCLSFYLFNVVFCRCVGVGHCSWQPLFSVHW